MIKKFMQFHEAVINLPFQVMIQSKKEISYRTFSSPFKVKYVGINELFERIFKRDFSGFFVIEGRGRTGKSTLAVWLGLAFTYLRDGELPKNFEEWLRTHVRIGLQNEQEIIQNYQKDVIIFNEAVVEAYKRLAMSQGNIALIRLFTILQRLNNLYIFVLPSYTMLDSDIRDHFTDVIFDVIRRGTAETYIGITRKIQGKKKKLWYFSGRLDFLNLPKPLREVFDKFDKEQKLSFYSSQKIEVEKPVLVSTAEGISSRLLDRNWVKHKK